MQLSVRRVVIYIGDIGETGRAFNTRKKKEIDTVKNSQLHGSNIANHAYSFEHEIYFVNSKIILPAQKITRSLSHST